MFGKISVSSDESSSGEESLLLKENHLTFSAFMVAEVTISLRSRLRDKTDQDTKTSAAEPN